MQAENVWSECSLWLAKCDILGIPNPVIVWIIVGLAVSYILRRTAFGRYIYAIGNREVAVYHSGVNTRLVIVGSFATLQLRSSALAGLLLAGYSSKAFQGMGDPYLLPSIAAVVIGGTNILGGSRRFSGTIAGTILIVLLQSVLSVMQMPEAGRQIIYGVVIVMMLLGYGTRRASGCDVCDVIFDRASLARRSEEPDAPRALRRAEPICFRSGAGYSPWHQRALALELRQARHARDRERVLQAPPVGRIGAVLCPQFWRGAHRHLSPGFRPPISPDCPADRKASGPAAPGCWPIGPLAVANGTRSETR